jgi:RNA polymerase sigma-70 factor, ECF subfamily
MFTNNQLLIEMPKLKRFGHKLTRNNTQADDLLQSTLLRALEKKDYFQDGTNLFSWTSKIMYNMFVTDYRRKVRFDSLYDPEEKINSMKINADQDVKLEFKQVSDAMEKLSESHKEIIILVCVKGMQYQETSELLNIPVGTVRSRLSRARIELEKILGIPQHGKDVSACMVEDIRRAL